jgi:hypothetical protein
LDANSTTADEENAMYVIREVMQCRPGKVREMVKRFKSLNELASKLGLPKSRIMTDVTGEPFWTVVGYTEVDNLNDYFAKMENAFGNEEVGKIMAGYHDLVASGKREIYKVES